MSALIALIVWLFGGIEPPKGQSNSRSSRPSGKCRKQRERMAANKAQTKMLNKRKSWR